MQCNIPDLKNLFFFWSFRFCFPDYGFRFPDSGFQIPYFRVASDRMMYDPTT